MQQEAPIIFRRAPVQSVARRGVGAQEHRREHPPHPGRQPLPLRDHRQHPGVVPGQTRRAGGH
eukprot:4857690-Heterocapsa_arctica.AAC.1